MATPPPGNKPKGQETHGSTKPAAAFPARKTHLTRWQVSELAANGKTVDQIADQLDITTRQVYYHLEHAETQAYIKQIRGALIESISSQLSDSAIFAIKTLRDLCTTGTDHVRVRAASSLLTHFRDITRDNILTSQSTPELVMAAIPLIVQTVGKDAILDAIGVDVTLERPRMASEASTGYPATPDHPDAQRAPEGPSGSSNEDNDE